MRNRWHRTGIAVLTAALVASGMIPAAASVGEGTAAPSFSESWGCGQPSTNSTHVERSGLLANGELLRGYRGDFFGRSVGEVRNSLFSWTVPMSGGHKVLMHERMMPALNQVTANLAAEQAKGNYYAINPRQTVGFSARTIFGTHRLSLHGHGVAIDINSATNPYRADNKLITDMPGWFVDAWRNAGFCWGGDWLFVKDAMHFSWMGPGATDGYGSPPMAYPVDTAAAAFTDQVLSTTTEFGTPNPAHQYIVADGDGDGLADVFQLLPRPNGTRLEYSQTDRDHSWCGIGRDHALDVDVGERLALMGDYSQTGRNDLVLLDFSGPNLTMEVSLKPTSFEESISVPTLIPSDPSADYLLGDHDRDGHVDLYVIGHDAAATSVTVFSGSDEFTTPLLSVDTGLGDTAGSLFTLGDIDLDELPDLFVITDGGEEKTVQILHNGYTAVAATHTLDVGGNLLDVRVNDYDGDGRGDLWLWDEAGRLSVRLGNTRLPGVGVNSWHNPPGWECNPDTPPYTFDGYFRDDDNNIHEENIEAIADLGVTIGCNPPYNDEFCPEREVTRGEMAAFLVRALGLADDGGIDWFGDDAESIFEADINRLAAAGITTGCNPPQLDEFCPEDTVTRGAMAAFLVRGLGLTENGGDLFIDDDGSIFEEDINRLATSGITFGCNPPVYDRYCPEEPVLRDQMASFLARALGS